MGIKELAPLHQRLGWSHRAPKLKRIASHLISRARASNWDDQGGGKRRSGICVVIAAYYPAVLPSSIVVIASFSAPLVPTSAEA
jgi:hypothetical protein